MQYALLPFQRGLLSDLRSIPGRGRDRYARALRKPQASLEHELEDEIVSVVAEGGRQGD
jgi:hypothetical protein